MISHASKQTLLQATGYLFFAIGLAGTILPLLPTTVFWIVAAVCFAKSAPGMYRRILSWPGVGPAIRDYIEAGVIGPRSKAAALTGMTMGAFLVAASPAGPYTVAGTILCIALAAVYVLTRPHARRPVTARITRLIA